MRKVLFTLIILSIYNLAIASDAKDLLSTANEAYRTNDFTTAIEQYEAILQSGFESKAVYYNLGNAYYRNEELGKAILNYERARIQAPNDADIKHNLKVARQQLQDEIEVLPEFFLTRWWHSTRMGLSISGWGILALFLLWLGIAGLIVWVLIPVRQQKKVGFILGVVLLVLFFLPLSLAISRGSFEKHSETAIIIKPEVELRAGPDEISNTVLALHQGTKVFILDQLEGWYRVMLENREEGWLEEEAIEEI